MTAAVAGLRMRLAPLLIRRIESRTEAERGPVDRLTVAQRLALTAMRDGPVSVSELASGTGVAISSATRMAQRLERMGLVARAAASADGDGRRRYLELTAYGREVADAADAVLSARLRELLAPLSAQRRRDVVTGMEAVIEALQLAEAASRRASSSATDGGSGDSGLGALQRSASNARPR